MSQVSDEAAQHTIITKLGGYLKTSHIIYPLLLVFLLSFAFCQAANNSALQTNSEIQNINQEIEFLNSELEKMRRDAHNKEMEAQPFMFDNWHEFANDIELSEENEKGILKIKKKIKELKQKRDLLQTQQLSPNTPRS